MSSKETSTEFPENFKEMAPRLDIGVCALQMMRMYGGKARAEGLNFQAELLDDGYPSAVWKEADRNVLLHRMNAEIIRLKEAKQANEKSECLHSLDEHIAQLIKLREKIAPLLN